MRRLTHTRSTEKKPGSGRLKAAGLLLAAPLAAGLIGACAEEALPDPCRIYNSTTITINRETDGSSADLRTIEAVPLGSFLTDYHIDFINEAHAIASEGLPPDTKATQSPSYCLMDEGDSHKSAYAQPRTEKGRERGFYIPENPELDPIKLLNYASHEIGHLQPGNPENGSEVLSQLNEYEQKLAGFALLFRQGADSEQLIRWASHEERTGLFDKLQLTIESGRGSPGNEPLDVYDLGNIFIFMKLREHAGDISAVRSDFRGIAEDGIMNLALHSMAGVFFSEYGIDNLPDLFIDVQAALAMAMESQYGHGMAYFEAHSSLLNSDPTSGLEGLSCTPIHPVGLTSYIPCSDSECAGLGADESRPVSFSLCCLGAEMQEGGIVLSKWVVEASGRRFRNSAGVLEIGGFGYELANGLSASRAEIAMDESCE